MSEGVEIVDLSLTPDYPGLVLKYVSSWDDSNRLWNIVVMIYFLGFHEHIADGVIAACDYSMRILFVSGGAAWEEGKGGNR